MEGLLGRNRFAILQLSRVAAPADFDAAKEIGLRARHAVEPRRTKAHLVAEDFGVGTEANARTAAILHRTEMLQRPLRAAAHETLTIELTVARNFDLEFRRQGVDHRDPDPVQPARSGVGAGLELAARVERGEDHLERRFGGKFGVRIDRDAATVVADRDRAVGAVLDLDAAGMAGNRLVHGIVEGLGDEMMQRPLVGSADEHAGALAHRLETLEDLDMGCGIIVARFADVFEQIGHENSAVLSRGAGFPR